MADLMSRILPSTVSVSEQIGTLAGVLLKEEADDLGDAVLARKTEFAAGRTCARTALEFLGFAATPLLRGSSREPLWPAGVVGSITHCEGYCAAAVARCEDLLSLGIDAEENKLLPGGIIETVAREEELHWLQSILFSGLYLDRLLFSIKESVYKTCYPLTKSWIGFEDVRVAIDLANCTFQAQLLQKSPLICRLGISSLAGQYLVSDGYILTAVTVDRPVG
jgi:4'-phosphopantetheinyl transferase EntD